MSEHDFHLYDTTLRDGAQQEGLSLTVDDKLAVARRLDAFGVTHIEGGWPGAIPKDTEFFRRARTELVLRNAQLVAFGATRRPGVAVEEDAQVAALLAADTPVVTLVAKSHDRHVRHALRTSLQENLAMVRDTVRYLVRHGRQVFVDAEHFFDGYRADPEYALAVACTAAEAGADVVVLCDTNGGFLPDELGEIVAEVARTVPRIGIHCHDDSGCAVANSLAAVTAGADHVQVTAHGYGERCGNANLFSVVANLAFKHRNPVITQDQLAGMSELAEAIDEITAIPSRSSAPYVGASAFAHKAGLHASAVRVDPGLYQHIAPEDVGNVSRTLISDMAGRSSIELKARELGYEVPADSAQAGELASRVKELEKSGVAFDSADASFELLLREVVAGRAERFFEVKSWRYAVRRCSDGSVEGQATTLLAVDGHLRICTGTGNDPITALDRALRRGLGNFHPRLDQLRLTDHRTRVVERRGAETAAVQVLASFTHGGRRWKTVGVAEETAAASLRALCDAFDYFLGRPVSRPDARAAAGTERQLAVPRR